jgi:mediator of RNA polymerase II transcription subunit 6
MDIKDNNSLALSWHDSNWIPHLNPTNILDYFSERSNPFYERTCNNEIIKMQRVDPEQMKNMVGLEFILLHCQEPILYVVRKQHRHSPTEVTPLADYYILAGTVYQAPDVNTVITSRILTGVHHLLSAFDEVHSYMRYHPTKGYSWDFGKDNQADKEKEQEKLKEKNKEKAKEDHSSIFQKRRVDLLLGELTKAYPPKLTPPAQSASDTKSTDDGKAQDVKPEKQESVQSSNTSNSQRNEGLATAKKARVV